MARAHTIPLDEPVLVDLGDDDEVVAAASDVEVVQDDEPVHKKPDEEPEAESVIASLKSRIEEADAARNEADKRTKVEAEARAKAEAELAQGRSHIADTEANAVAHGLFASQIQVTNAKAEIKAAFENGDATALADAQERLGRAAAEVRDYERLKTDMARKPVEKVEPRQTQQQPRDVNEMIDAMQLLPAERTWLKAHPETLMDRSRNIELDAAYIKATRKGISRGTPDYFKFLETELGFSPENDMNDRNTQVSAPVTRNGGSSGGLRPNQVRLSPQQREMASMLGLSDKEYAEGVIQMEGDKRVNPEKYARR